MRSCSLRSLSRRPIFLSRRLKLEEAKRRVFVCSLVFCNITFIGYPILQELYGNIGLLCAIVFSMIYNVVFYSWGMFYLGDRGRGSLRSILTNKIALASVLALVMYFLQIKIPEPLYSTFNGIGALTMPLSMIIIGCSLADSGICKILRDPDALPSHGAADGGHAGCCLPGDAATGGGSGDHPHQHRDRGPAIRDDDQHCGGGLRLRAGLRGRISWCRPCWPCWLPCPPGSSWWGCRLGTQSASFHSLFEKIKEGITTW